ncbi:MAG: 5,10-methylenetetrahydrofolate reductase, partial [Chloroflexi bacterium RBG_16_50_11]
MSLQSKLESGKFAISCEFGPIKGTDTHEITENIEILKGKVDAANVTDQQSAVMRLSGLVTSTLCVQGGLEPIFQMTCRDRNRIALQSDLLGAWVMGIKNVLALTGDLPALGDHPQAKGVFDLDSVTLLQAITRLNEGFDLAGTELKGKPAFFPGAVVKVDSNTEASAELQIYKFEKKIAAGAKFFQTQSVYDPASFARFMKRVEKFKVPVMAGIIPLKNAGMAKFMNANVAGVHVPDDLIQKMSAAPKEDREKVG